MPAGWISGGRGTPARRTVGIAPNARPAPATDTAMKAVASASPRLSGNVSGLDAAQLSRDIKDLVRLLPESTEQTRDLISRLLDAADTVDPAIEAKVYALSAGQLTQMSRLFTASEAALEPLEQPVVVVRHDSQGHAGPGLYAQRDGEGPSIYLDGRVHHRR